MRNLTGWHAATGITALVLVTALWLMAIGRATLDIIGALR